jgi:hypothetical protein
VPAVSLDTLLRRYPRLGPAKILDALAFAYDNEEVMLADIERESELLDKVAPASTKSGSSEQMSLPFSDK